MLFARGVVRLTNVPNLSDTYHLIRLVKSLGVDVTHTAGGGLIGEVDHIVYDESEFWRVPLLRSSILLLGTILAETGHVALPIPGGDRLGERPLDEFIHILNAFGIESRVSGDVIRAQMTSMLRGDRVVDVCPRHPPRLGTNSSHLAILLAAANAGTTVLEDVIIAPEVAAHCRFLQLIGDGALTIDGIGDETIVIRSAGLDAIHECGVSGQTHCIEPDLCEIALWVAGASLTRGAITCQLSNGGPETWRQLHAMKTTFLDRAEIPVQYSLPGELRVDCSDSQYAPNGFDLVSTRHVVDGIPLDACPLLATVLFKARGKGSFRCYKHGRHRIEWAKDVRQLGGRCDIRGDALHVEGVSRLLVPPGTEVVLRGTGIREAGALLLCALATEGGSVRLLGTEHLDRGIEGWQAKASDLSGTME
jgi:UDP-N-acetylglucosamine 1-carboxyvinyltransferase